MSTWFALGSLAAFGIGHLCARSGQQTEQQLAELREMSLTKLSQLTEGEEIEGLEGAVNALQSGESRRVLLKGRLVAANDAQLLASPLAEKQVLGFHSKVVRVVEEKRVKETRSESKKKTGQDEQHESEVKKTKETYWKRTSHTVLDQSTNVPVSLDDGSATARVLDNCNVMRVARPEKHEWLPLEEAQSSGALLDVMGGLEFRMGGVSLSLGARSPDRRTIGLRAEESVLEAGAEVVFVGDARLDVDGSLVLAKPEDSPVVLSRKSLHEVQHSLKNSASGSRMFSMVFNAIGVVAAGAAAHGFFGSPV